MTDADLDGVIAGKPDAILLPKAEGGPAVIHLDAKLTAREAIHGLQRRRDQDPRVGDRDGGVAVRVRHLSGFVAAPDRHHLGRGGPLRRARRRDQSRHERPVHLALHAGAQSLARGGLIGARAGDRHGVCGLPQHGWLARGGRGGPPRRLHRQDGDPSGASSDHQRGVHADPRGDRNGAGGGRGVRGRSVGRRGRDRRRDVRPPSPDARATPAGAVSSRRREAAVPCPATKKAGRCPACTLSPRRVPSETYQPQLLQRGRTGTM